MDIWEDENESVLFYEVTKVLTRYARGVDRADWDLMVSAFHPDALDDHGFGSVGTPAQLVGTLKPLSPPLATMNHLTGNVVLLEIDRGRRAVLVESLCIGWQRLEPGLQVLPPLFRAPNLGPADGQSRLSAVLNRYFDLITERDGRFAIERRTVIYEWSAVELSDDQRVLDNTTRGIRSTSDLSYQSIDEYWPRR